MHTIKVHEPWFSKIYDGEKKIEGRLLKGIFTKLEVGDQVKWLDPKSDRSIITEVTALPTYCSFKEMLEKEGLENVLPGVGTLDDGVAVYDKFFPQELQKQFKVVAIHIKPVTT